MQPFVLIEANLQFSLCVCMLELGANVLIPFFSWQPSRMICELFPQIFSSIRLFFGSIRARLNFSKFKNLWIRRSTLPKNVIFFDRKKCEIVNCSVGKNVCITHLFSLLRSKAIFTFNFHICEGRSSACFPQWFFGTISPLFFYPETKNKSTSQKQNKEFFIHEIIIINLCSVIFCCILSLE